MIKYLVIVNDNNLYIIQAESKEKLERYLNSNLLHPLFDTSYDTAWIGPIEEFTIQPLQEWIDRNLLTLD